MKTSKYRSSISAALRGIARIVKDIKAKIIAAAGNTPGIGDTAGDPSGSTITSSNRGTDISGKKKDERQRTNKSDPPVN
jgi:hypothetical protein